MQGHIDVLDLKDSSGVYSSYIIGSYKSGLGQFVLKLNSSSATKSDLGSQIWDIDETSTTTAATSAPNNGKRVYFSDNAGKVYTAYIVTSGTTSYAPA